MDLEEIFKIVIFFGKGLTLIFSQKCEKNKFVIFVPEQRPVHCELISVNQNFFRDFYQKISASEWKERKEKKSFFSKYLRNQTSKKPLVFSYE